MCLCVSFCFYSLFFCLNIVCVCVCVLSAYCHGVCEAGSGCSSELSGSFNRKQCSIHNQTDFFPLLIKFCQVLQHQGCFNNNICAHKEGPAFPIIPLVSGQMDRNSSGTCNCGWCEDALSY